MMPDLRKWNGKVNEGYIGKILGFNKISKTYFSNFIY